MGGEAWPDCADARPRHDARLGHRRWLDGEPLPGIWVVDDGMAKGAAIDQLALAISCLEPEECKDKILYFPLR